ncbi:MAG: type IV pilus assembly protein PilM [Pseudanabaena sp. M135S2SP2A07QC]|nr:type IV pilus assembly protein PilM [Pseudanabaena sp. M090S1SP2A07QC]MCA6505740.1 type IV pilus assembly protein PilM [Pseudanabaena sp. M172S2SP2A07QC]MCA6521916.1 type IV pilus assembly protein PilM [Pseudanabaena sp. M051S1SP2A07QC]MCA6524503.1 type IV pilus assembly protein PilM [Pseudanabaena sp. M179S2SP2A07QC]MCA6528563.1 type IV pilus assembly protein PilM [Pseudanabaena sp. M125S2SP2A07QC]MCA6534444.1 type IV pilus assembly protein PilM [Pseudanabaena sp. M176S2SP2A07QC]MCA653945
MFGLKFGGKSKKGIGIEITSEKVNLVQLRRKGQSSYKLVTYGSVELPEGTVEEGRILDPVALGEVIRSLLADKKIKVKKVATALPGRETVSRLIRLPAEIPDLELREMVLNQEASLYLPFPREDADVDYQKLGTTLDDDGIERIEILMVATPKEVTDSYMQALEIAQLEVDVVEISSFALIRAMRNELARFGTLAEAVAIVDIEYEGTEITVTVDGVPQFSRTFPIGTAQIQNAQLRAMNLPPRRTTDMEMLSSTVVPVQSMDTASLAGGSGTPGDAAIMRAVGDLSDELRRSIDFYTSQSPGSDVVQLLIAGPGACIGQLNEFFSQRLGIAAVAVDPLTAVGVTVDGDIPIQERMAMSVALGLSLREV